MKADIRVYEPNGQYWRYDRNIETNLDAKAVAHFMAATLFVSGPEKTEFVMTSISGQPSFCGIKASRDRLAAVGYDTLVKELHSALIYHFVATE